MQQNVYAQYNFRAMFTQIDNLTFSCNKIIHLKPNKES